MPFRFQYLLDDELDLIAAARMCLRSYVVGVAFVIVAKMADAVGVRLQRLLEFAEQRRWGVEALMAVVPEGRQGALLFVEKLVGDYAHDEPAEPDDAVPVAYRRAVIDDVLEHVARVDRVNTAVGKRQCFSVVTGEVEVHPDRVRQDRDWVRIYATVSDVDDDFARHIGGKKAVLQLFLEGAAGLALDRPILRHLVSAKLYRHSGLVVVGEPACGGAAIGWVPCSMAMAWSAMLAGAICFMHKWSLGHSSSLS